MKPLGRIGSDGGLVAGEAAFSYLTGQMIGRSMTRTGLPPLSQSPFGLLRWVWLADFRCTARGLRCSLCGKPFTEREMKWGIGGPGATGRLAMLLLHEACYQPVGAWLRETHPHYQGEGCA